MQIGIFWLFGDKVHFKQQATGLEPFKCNDTDLGSYKNWQKFLKQQLKQQHGDYEVPRGRIIYISEHKNFLIYCNDQILEDNFSQSLVVEKFNLQNQKVRFVLDEHYEAYSMEDLV